MDYSVISYSFHRTVAAGEMDVFDYITWCKEHGFTYLDPWMRHLEAGFADDAFIAKVKAAGEAVGLPFGCVAIDGGHIYMPTAEERAATRQKAYRWLEIAAMLGARQVRIDAGGREESLDEIFDIVVEGYNDLVGRAREQGIEVLIENHWGPTKDPNNLYKVLEAVDGLGLLFDTSNWPEDTHEDAWVRYAPYARLTHIKTSFDKESGEPTLDIPKAIRLLREAGYAGSWAIEAEAAEWGEEELVLMILALIKRELGEG
ncbi:MAG: sugar phosphate isomerase/epimerase [Ardenticatenaceae bacterium]|nr:sugar phosphate isomerase/epimerase [Ardenticatenaceae bacterium]